MVVPHCTIDANNNIAGYGAQSYQFGTFHGLSESPWEITNNSSVKHILESNVGIVKAGILRNLKCKLLHKMSDAKLSDMRIYRQTQGQQIDNSGKRVPQFTNDGTWSGIYLYDVNLDGIL